MTCQEAIDVMGEALEGRLAADLGPGFEEHMAECRPCSTYFQHLRITREGLLSLPPEDGPNSRRQELIEAFRRELDRN